MIIPTTNENKIIVPQNTPLTTVQGEKSPENKILKVLPRGFRYERSGKGINIFRVILSILSIIIHFLRCPKSEPKKDTAMIFSTSPSVPLLI
jgi:hypothetical protein